MPTRLRPSAASPTARRLAGDEGSALIEFALTVPLLVVTVMVAMAVMQIIQARFAVQAAAREAAMVGSQVGSSISPYDKATTAASLEVDRVLTEYGLSMAQATLSFDGTPADMARGSLFQVHLSYDVQLPAPTVPFFEISLGGSDIFTVDSDSIIPIQLHKARWPCPSPDPICS